MDRVWHRGLTNSPSPLLSTSKSFGWQKAVVAMMLPLHISLSNSSSTTLHMSLFSFTFLRTFCPRKKAIRIRINKASKKDDILLLLAS
jgi:hypothetical protein